MVGRVDDVVQDARQVQVRTQEAEAVVVVDVVVAAVAGVAGTVEVEPVIETVEIAAFAVAAAAVVLEVAVAAELLQVPMETHHSLRAANQILAIREAHLHRHRRRRQHWRPQDDGLTRSRHPQPRAQMSPARCLSGLATGVQATRY